MHALSITTIMYLEFLQHLHRIHCVCDTNHQNLDALVFIGRSNVPYSARSVQVCLHTQTRKAARPAKH